MINEILGKKNINITFKVLESKYSSNAKATQELNDFKDDIGHKNSIFTRE